MAREAGVRELNCLRCRGVDPGAEVAAQEKRLHVGGEAPGVADERPKRTAERDLVHAGNADRTGERDERGPRLVDRPDRAKPLRAEAHDEPEVRERLDVLHQSRSTPDASLERPRRRERRECRAAVQELDERRLLTRDETVGDRHDTQRHTTVVT